MAKIYDFTLYEGGKHMSEVTVFDVAKYILEELGSMTTMKLQKLVYYSQAWSLVWDEEPLFSEEFQAWANGPVCPDLFYAHKGLFKISKTRFRHGDSSKLSSHQIETLDSVINYYGDKDGHWLSMLTHKERPWKDAREGYPDGDSCEEIITKESMQDYYSGIK